MPQPQPHQHHFFDLNVPLPVARRKYHAHLCQSRLHQLGYHGIAFCHTAFGRLKPERDDADEVLPWNDLLVSSSSNDETLKSKISMFGRTSLGMKIYRRLNIVIEEVSDVSQLLLPSTADAKQSLRDLLQKYDLISLQPMNENVLQSVSEMLSQSDASNSTDSLTSYVQIIVLEYATGSKGGYALPYKLRKDYVVKVLEAGVTFELNYSTAMLDAKRRQGFLSTLVEFQSTFNAIQKKHMLLNKFIHSHQYHQAKCKSESFPLLLSSGIRQNFSAGTDEGIMALRSPHDVAFIVNHLTGSSLGPASGENGSCETNVKRKGKKRIISSAERVLAKAREHSMGLVSCKTMRALVVKTGRDDHSDDSEEEEGNGCDSLKEWLSKPLRKRQKLDAPIGKIDEQKEDKVETNKATLLSRKERDLVAVTKESDKKKPHSPIANDDDDLEDGYIAL
jgi:hypothetical protein